MGSQSAKGSLIAECPSKSYKEIIKILWLRRVNWLRDSRFHMGRYLMSITVAIFLPAFLLVAASGPLVPRIRRSKIAGAFLDGVNVVSLALMAEVSWQLVRASVVDVVTIVLAVASLIALLQFRLNSGWLVLIGASSAS